MVDENQPITEQPKVVKEYIAPTMDKKRGVSIETIFIFFCLFCTIWLIVIITSVHDGVNDLDGKFEQIINASVQASYEKGVTDVISEITRLSSSCQPVQISYNDINTTLMNIECR